MPSDLGGNQALTRFKERKLSPQEFISELKTVLKEEKTTKEVQKQVQFALNSKTHKDLVLSKNELLWILKKQENHLQELRSFAQLNQDKLTSQEKEALKELHQELRLREALVTKWIVKLGFKESDYLSQEADFALPPQLDPEIPKLFDENKVPRFYPALPRERPTIEPQ